jgi:hypothetical protein
MTEGMSGETTVTEAEWLNCTDPSSLLHHLDVKAGKRKCRLFVCACERRLWNEPDCQREKIEVTERYADGEATTADVAAAIQRTGLDETDAVYFANRAGEVRWAISESLDSAALVADAELRGRSLKEGRELNRSELDLAREAGYEIEKCVQCDLLRDICGNPFRPMTVAPKILTWNDAVVVRLAQTAYDERQMPDGTLDNGRLTVLADALEEAGCTDAETLDHLRSPGPHVRGCWAVDLCLGKS